MVAPSLDCEHDSTDRPQGLAVAVVARCRERGTVPDSESDRSGRRSVTSGNCRLTKPSPTGRGGNVSPHSLAATLTTTTNTDLEAATCATSSTTQLATGLCDKSTNFRWSPLLDSICHHNSRQQRTRALPPSASLLMVNVNHRQSHKLQLAEGALPALLLVSLLALLVSLGGQSTSLAWARSTGGSQKLATAIQSPQLPYLDDDCNKQPDMQLNEAGRLLMLLKCDIKPLYEQFERAYGKDAADSIGAADRVGLELASMSERVREFADEGLSIIGLKDFCNTNMVDRIGRLKTKAADSRLLTEAFNLIAIEYHGSCLKETLSSLPKVPSLVSEVVDIYIAGADEVIHKPQISLDIYGDQKKFDVDAAIKRSGPLKDVVGLTLAMGTTEKVARDFREQCKNLVVQTDNHWSVMSTMNRLVDTDDNNILRLNNAVLRTLAPTKFADICSQLSARSA